jgi:hypothetical protein
MSPAAARSLALIAALLMATPAWADRNPEAEEAAAEATEVFDSYCSQTAMDDMTLAAGAVAEVSATWKKVSATLDSTKKVYLLYWRGVLAQCLDQEERALTDLNAFVAATEGSTLWAGLIKDAKTRVRRLEAAEVAGPANPGLAGGIVGGILAAGSGATAGLAGWQWSEALAAGEHVLSEPHKDDDLINLFIAGDTAQQLTWALAAGAGALGAAALASFIVSGAEKTKYSAARPTVQPVFAAVPTPDGVLLVVGGRW